MSVMQWDSLVWYEQLLLMDGLLTEFSKGEEQYDSGPAPVRSTGELWDDPDDDPEDADMLGEFGIQVREAG
jgi:hypothetical protein